MERVFKIKTRSEPDLSNQYPSERRYSASIVLGLSAVLLQFSLCSMLMGGLIIHKMSVLGYVGASSDESTDESVKRLSDKLESDLEYSNQNYLHYYINVPALISAGCFLMAFGDMLAFITGLLAWKQWYMDHNITFFFLSCSFSTLTSCISLLISLLTSSNLKFDRYEDFDNSAVKEFLPISLPLAANIIILSVISAIWSFLATKIAYRGMRNSYPDDVVVKRGRVEVNTVKKGNQNNISTIPIEVINNFAVGNMAKYLPKKENSDLPKQESNAEYQQRVNKFLNGEPEMDQNEQEEKHEAKRNIEEKLGPQQKAET